jgi:hypothetical protein
VKTGKDSESFGYCGGIYSFYCVVIIDMLTAVTMSITDCGTISYSRLNTGINIHRTHHPIRVGTRGTICFSDFIIVCTESLTLLGNLKWPRIRGVARSAGRCYIEIVYLADQVCSVPLRLAFSVPSGLLALHRRCISASLTGAPLVHGCLFDVHLQPCLNTLSSGKLLS